MTTDRKAGHTAGPWVLEPGSTGMFVMPMPDSTNPDSMLGICQVYEFDGERSPTRARANAHLIAAAPDLLAALTHLTAVMGMYNKTPEEHLALTQAVRAIQSARGETAAQPKP